MAAHKPPECIASPDGRHHSTDDWWCDWCSEEILTPEEQDAIAKQELQDKLRSLGITRSYTPGW